MTRYLFCLAVLGVGAVPDWATAYHPCWVPPPCGPAPAYPQYFYLVPPAAPVYEVPLPPPAVYPVPRAAVRAQEPAPARPWPAPAPVADPPVRPAVGTTPAPLPSTVAPTTKAAPTPKTPEPAPKADPAIPPLVLPDPPAAPPKAEPKGPSLVLPPDLPVLPAVPTPAPSPDAEPKRNTESIPPLVLPPDTPAGPTGVIPPTTARSSPLAAASRVEVFAVTGQTAGGALRRVGFFNHTDRDLRLTIEGERVTLPAKSFLHAELPPSFRWSEAGGPPRRTTVPADSAGVDVLFRAGE